MTSLNSCGVEFSSFSKNLRNLKSYVAFSFIVFNICFFNFYLKSHLLVLVFVEFNAVAIKSSYCHVGGGALFDEVALRV